MTEPTRIEHDRRTAAEIMAELNNTDERQEPEKFINLHRLWLEVDKEERSKQN
jgi:hypothetical protein